MPRREQAWRAWTPSCGGTCRALLDGTMAVLHLALAVDCDADTDALLGDLPAGLRARWPASVPALVVDAETDALMLARLEVRGGQWALAAELCAGRPYRAHGQVTYEPM